MWEFFDLKMSKVRYFLILAIIFLKKIDFLVKNCTNCTVLHFVCDIVIVVIFSFGDLVANGTVDYNSMTLIL